MRLIFTVLEAHDLPKLHSFRPTNPYVEVECCGVTARSSPVKNSRSPKWLDAQFHFDISSPEDLLIVAIMDKCMGTDKVLGQITVSVQSVCQQTKKQGSSRLRLKDSGPASILIVQAKLLEKTLPDCSSPSALKPTTPVSSSSNLTSPLPHVGSGSAMAPDPEPEPDGEFEHRASSPPAPVGIRRGFSMCSNQVLGTLETLGAELNELEAEVAALEPSDRDDIGKLFGTIEKLLLTRIDAVATSDLSTGQQQARTERKMLVVRAQKLLDRLSELRGLGA
eukprot:NODE_539_length_1568_cov_186.141540_g406_i0.p1 GENE.NODE_539_length_1568_cov_186.141540_g406_i0~~NODE_539_length_1568_cov_186.141540_g406_i0.p1  ORF type:complete len:297 (-),score=71.60 NODE_539_length_1568_cov_186.141540_g406_i0:677-1513(-)